MSDKIIVNIGNRHHFVIPTNPGEQFYTFTCLAAWLIRKAGKSFEIPQESDDPNSTIALILDYLREIDIPVEFPPNKLKQGSGEHAVYVLDNLADNALKVEQFKWKRYSSFRRNFLQIKQIIILQLIMSG